MDTVVGPGSAVRGDFRVSGGLRLDGQVDGRMDLGGGFVAGSNSLLKGELHCRDAVIAGRIEGNVFAREVVELQAGAHVIGNIECKSLVVHRGSFFQGSCTMTGEVKGESRQNTGKVADSQDRVAREDRDSNS